MDTYSVYCHRNKANGKRYIGITSVSPKKRWQNGLGYRSCYVFYNAIKKYGWDGFDHIVLCENLSKEDAVKMEKDLIKKHKTTQKEHGYNMSGGGSTLTDKAKEHLSAIHMGDKNINYGKPCNENAMKALCKELICIETQVRFKSVSDAHRQTGINLGHIASVCRGERKTAGGFHWQYVNGGDYHR